MMKKETAIYLDNFETNVQKRIWKAFHGEKFVSFERIERKFYSDIDSKTKTALNTVISTMQDEKAKILILF